MASELQSANEVALTGYRRTHPWKMFPGLFLICLGIWLLSETWVPSHRAAPNFFHLPTTRPYSMSTKTTIAHHESGRHIRPLQVTQVPRTADFPSGPAWPTIPTKEESTDWSKYAPIDLQYPGVRVIHAEPPVVLVDHFLSDAECDLFINAATTQQLDPFKVDYNAGKGHVMLDWSRLQPLLVVPLLAAVPHAVKASQLGAPIADIVGPSLGIVAATAIGLGTLVGTISLFLEHATQWKVFTGQKWTLAASDVSLSLDAATSQAYDEYLGRLEKLLKTKREHFEVPLLTRYNVGERQLIHDDARRPGSKDFAAFLKHGGQREVQSVVYLNTLSSAQGGGTKFHDPIFDGLTVQPSKGALLIFFPTFRDGSIDPRMPHSGQEVLQGTKWILNTWKTQLPVDRRNRP